jgi:large subunit ribosomal protein L23
MSRHILIKPVVTEKSDIGSKKGRYTFIVEKKANKIEISKAVEDMFNVTVDFVNTSVMPKKSKVRNTRSGMVRGAVASYKKAYVQLVAGEKIDLFGAEDEEAQ